MPTSTYNQITTVLRFLQQVMPGSILDIGLGNGKMGFLARDFLDVMLGGRYLRKDWKVRIDGIEIFAAYIQDHQRAIYDQIHLGDAYAVIDGLGDYDVIIVGDVLEHFERERALRFLGKCFEHTQNVILSIPLGEKWTQGAIYGNEHEQHLSFWNQEEFEGMASDKDLIEFPGLGIYGSFFITKSDYIHDQARKEASRLCAEGLYSEAFSRLEGKTATLSPNLNTELLAVELLVRQSDVARALTRLEQLKSKLPEEASIQGVIDQLRMLDATNR